MDQHRTLALNKHPAVQGKVVVYVMARDQRVQDNHALLSAQAKATSLAVPLVVVFNLLPKNGVRSREQYQFMVDGLKKVEKDLSALNIGFILTIGTADIEISKLCKTIQSSAVYFDFSPLRGARKLQKDLALAIDCECFVVDTHNIIPVWVTSPKQEFAAHTMRSKVHKLLEYWLVEPPKLQKDTFGFETKELSANWQEVDTVLEQIPGNGSKINFISGEAAGHSVVRDFITHKLDNYAAKRNIPIIDATSNFSPYLHFGQLSSLRIALEVLKVANDRPLLFEKAKLASFEGLPTKMDSINGLLEEMIVRKELADNYCFYTPNYDNLDGAWQWAKDTLAEHASDPREPLYALKELEAAQTHDAAWNACQNQMMRTGKMHGYMRMYWAKKILEWTESPEEAVSICIYLNDHYSIDGGDPNGYVGIMWSVAGVHDRPWFSRPIFGKIRYMNDGGLARKFDLVTYIKNWQ